MAKMTRIGMRVETVCTLDLTDEEVKALDALVGYGADSFLRVFYQQLGKSYLSPHEAGLRSLFEAVRGCAHLTKAADECREFLALMSEEERRAVLHKKHEDIRMSRIS
jgi:hypothetical protein